MYFPQLFLCLGIAIFPVIASAQNENRNFQHWPGIVQKVRVPCSADRSFQEAYFYASRGGKPQPLIVSLHSWSADFTQEDKLLPEILDLNWNYIHPNFRGPNIRPQACGSDLVISDIEDAIYYAIDHGQVDTSEIHIIGSSGGGHASLMMYMKTRFHIKSFSAWVPISNLVDWYWSSKSRNLRYAGHILAATHSQDSVLNVDEAKKRSPFFQPTPVALRQNSSLTIYCGIHDGYTGSVPISQSVLFYNKLVKDMGANDDDLVPANTLNYLLSQRTYEPFMRGPQQYLGDRQIHYSKQYKQIQLVIFEGGHETIVEAALGKMKR